MGTIGCTFGCTFGSVKSDGYPSLSQPYSKEVFVSFCTGNEWYI